MTTEIIVSAVVSDRLADELPKWQLSGDGLSIHRKIATNGFKSSLMIVNAIGFLAETAWHHPEIIIGYGVVQIYLTTHSEGGVTGKDLELAKKIEELLHWPQGNGALEPPPDKFAVLKAD